MTVFCAASLVSSCVKAGKEKEPAAQPAQPAAPAGNAPAGGNEPENVITLTLDHVPYEVLDDYDTALGITNLSMSTGEMYE